MEPSCIAQTLIPGTSRLFADFLYAFDKVAPFYHRPFLDLDGLAQAARTIDFPDDRRQQIVSALREQNGTSPALDRLAQPGTVAVVTGQQAGLLLGPGYTLYKALTAVRLAQELKARGVDAVPVFWIATEDHDLAEVNHAWLYDESGLPSRVMAADSASPGSPVGTVEINDFSVQAVQRALGGLPFAPEMVRRVQEHYGQPTTFARSFRHFLEQTLQPFELLYLDPLAPSIRTVAEPFLREAAQCAPELAAALRKRGRELEQAGYHSQVFVDDSTSLLFLLEDNRRTALRYRDGRFALRDSSFTAEELAARAQHLSPNALLRPVMQDYLLPTAVYVAGPAEIAYFAQSEVLYSALLGRMPVIYPRNSLTLLDARASKLLGRYGLRFEDLLTSQDQARAAIAHRLLPDDLVAGMDALRKQMEGSLKSLRNELMGFDPTLAEAADRSTAKMLYQLEKLHAKTGRETLRRDRRATADGDYLLNKLYPRRQLQERFYSVVSLLAEFGPDLPTLLYERVQLNCPDHSLRVV